MKIIIFSVMILSIASPLFAAEARETAYIREGTHYLTGGNYIKAVHSFKNAISINPGRADAYAGLGAGYMKLGINESVTIPEMVENAVNAFSKAAALDPHNADICYNLGMAYLALDQKESSLKQHGKLALLDRGKAAALLERIKAYTPPQIYTPRISDQNLYDDNSSSTRVYIRNNQVRVPVQLSYRNNVINVWMVLDTGATTTMITSKVADSLGIRPEHTVRMLASVADGTVARAYTTIIDHIAVGPKQKEKLRVVIMPVNDRTFTFGDGLLGMNFLANYKYHLDMKKQTIEWQK